MSGVADFFWGPQGEKGEFILHLWTEVFKKILQQRRETFPEDDFEATLESFSKNSKKMSQEMDILLDYLKKEVPTYSPRYIGHMLSDVSIPAVMGSMAMSFCNPNIASSEVAKTGQEIERQAINELLKMVGYDVKKGRGHFTSGGTVANFEALWRARYRWDSQMSLALYLLDKGISEEPFFKLVHMGPQRFKSKMEELQIKDEDLYPYSYVIQGLENIIEKVARLNLGSLTPSILVPKSKHYSWPKSLNVFGLGSRNICYIDLDSHGRMCPDALRKEIIRHEEIGKSICMVVSVAGSTELGIIDPVHRIQDVLNDFRASHGLWIWHHVDAAYGGYYCSMLRGSDADPVLGKEAHQALAGICAADSVTLDPHKLGYTPYGCGSLLVKNPDNYAVSSIDAAYLENSNTVESPSWSTTFEGSRSAAGAAAVWMSSKVLPLNSEGHGKILAQGMEAKNFFEECLSQSDLPVLLMPSSPTNILCFFVGSPGERLSNINKKTKALLQSFKDSPEIAVSTTRLSHSLYTKLLDNICSKNNIERDIDYLQVVRMVFMSPYLGHPDHVQKLLGIFLQELKTGIKKLSHK